ncbi:MAG: hypothetical protein KKF56_00080 [Nanoarchaeota archaeon]|nr:hypothetical protein [Nanoarchaeota archaeon]
MAELCDNCGNIIKDVWKVNHIEGTNRESLFYCSDKCCEKLENEVEQKWDELEENDEN